MMVTTPSLSISPEKVCFFVVKAREFDVKDVVTDPNSGSNPSDDAMIAVLEDHPDDPTYQELRSFIGALTEDEQIDLVALTWLGHGDGTIDEWDDLRRKPRACTTTARPPICSQNRCWPTTSKRGFRNSAVPARTSKAAGPGHGGVVSRVVSSTNWFTRNDFS
jgi:Protein of unknown function (DUF3775)